MAKLKSIVKQLSETDYQSIYDGLLGSNADKSAYLLKSLRSEELSDNQIMDALEVNTNAYYTLRSRLNQKIEEYLLQQMESPRTDLLKKVANISEIVFTKKRAIAIATLKKLEKELLEYDLSNELTVVYKALKKLHINTSEYYTYSQLYNKHVAFMLAVDKAEDLLAEYFRKFGNYALTGDETDQLGLVLVHNEMENVCKLYKSHRLYVYQSCMTVFHRLFVEKGENLHDEGEPIEDILNQVQKIIQNYKLDTTYYHLNLVFDYLRLEYYNHYKVYRKAERFYDDVNESIGSLLANYSLYTFPAQFLNTKIERFLRSGTPDQIHPENHILVDDFELDMNDIPKYIYYMVYIGLSYHYAGMHQESANWLNELLNEVSLKKYPYALLEVKALLCLQYCLLKEYELFNQLVNSTQRQIRILGKDQCDHIVNFIKILKTGISDSKKEKEQKIKYLLDRTNNLHRKIFSPTQYIVFDPQILDQMSMEG